MKGPRPRPLTTMVAALCLMIASMSSHAAGAMADVSRVTVDSHDWQLIGDLVIPATESPAPAILMLNQAAGDRTVYAPLADALAARGIASLRLDLRGHGDSVNKGSFVPGEQPRSPMIWDAEVDVIAAIDFLRANEEIDESRIAVIGGSYSGEEMAEAGRLNGYETAYVALSPGSFSTESIGGIDSSGVPWLFVTSRDERFLQDIRSAVTDGSSTVEQIIVPGTGHATDLLEEYPALAERIAVWLESRL